jgi:3-deoxy-D-arabino-heptulosonate 7-phosphate (DAHP) synthase
VVSAQREEHFIRDRTGRVYRLSVTDDTDTVYNAIVLDGHIWVGEFKCLVHSINVLELCDIVIWANALRRDNFVVQIVRAIMRQPQTINYRSQGLGTELLRYIIEQARNKGMKRIVGLVVPRDLANTPNLIEWYQSAGFVVTDAPPNPLGAITAIHLCLDNNA